MRLALILLNAGVVLVFVIRFMQPQFLYWARRLVVDVRLGKFILDKVRKRRVNQRDYVKLLVQDLRPEGVTSIREILPRVNKVRELYSILDSRRKAVRDLPEARNSQICVVELANLMSAVAQNLRPNQEFDDPSIRANDLLFMIAERRNSQRHGGIGKLPEQSNEAELEAYLRRHPLTLGQLNEILIAATYAAMYRLLLFNAVRFRSSLFVPNIGGADGNLNSCCEATGRWLRERLEHRRCNVTGPQQGRRGWYIGCAKGDKMFTIEIAYLMEPDSLWQLVLKPRRSLKDRLLGHSGSEEALPRDLYIILTEAPEIEITDWLQLNE